MGSGVGAMNESKNFISKRMDKIIRKEDIELLTCDKLLISSKKKPEEIAERSQEDKCYSFFTATGFIHTGFIYSKDIYIYIYIYMKERETDRQTDRHS